MDKVEIPGWERSKISNQDQNTLKKLGLLKKQDSLIFPGDESFPRPPIGYRVTFIDHLIRGLSAPIHEFLRGILFVYGIQLHQLTPNSLLHISIFITLCECFLGTHPHWGLWKRIFYLRRNNSRNIVYNKFSDADPAWDAEATAEEKAATEALMKRIHTKNTHGEELSGVQITAYFLRIRVQPMQARKNPLWIITKFYLLFPLPEGGQVDERAVVIDGSQESSSPESEVPGSHKSAASSEKESESDPSESGRSVSPPPAVSPRNKRKRDEVEDSGTSKPTGSGAEEASPEEEAVRMKKKKNLWFMHVMKHLIKLGTQFIGFRDEADDLRGRMGEDFTLHEAEEDRLLDPLSILELQGDLARTNISDARAAFMRLFPHFFPKQTQQEVDWAKAGNPEKMNKEKWKALVKDAKPHSKKILAFLSPKPVASASTANTEVK
ncbi:hypothetical protein QYE76_038926 [Lolium multiflorum]|uniref:Transposase (putative) gypsy type domain-containing protein n=1 Tax=Lolium multiflorum TaxID=4521 RepID=A0AAD8WU07_LOLMU|nr:hypothetical protein QYE76_038926 [Lolium multiflorum]